MDKAAFLDFVVEIVRRSDKAMGFEVIPRRWVVERTFGWMIRWRRLVRDYEKRLDVSEAMIHVAMGALLLRRVAHR
jgi:putative transposase